MGDGGRTDEMDPLRSVWFSLEVDDGGLRAAFLDLSINSEVNPVELGDPGALRQQVRPVIKLARPLNDDVELSAWHESVIAGQDARKDCTVTVFDASGRPICRYRLDRAWPFRIQIGRLALRVTEELLERVSLVCDHVHRVAL